MDTNVLSPREGGFKTYLEGEQENSRKLISNTKHFAAENNDDGPVTALGHMRRFVRKKSSGVFALLSKIATMATFIVIDNLARDAQINLKAIELEILRLRLESTTPPLTTKFTETVGVSDVVYRALNETVADFKKEISLIRQRTQETADPHFMGPLTEEFEAIRHGKKLGPLTCEFEAYSRLNEKGISYLPEHDTFVFPEKLIKDLLDQLDTPTSEQQNVHHIIHVFKEKAHPELINDQEDVANDNNPADDASPTYRIILPSGEITFAPACN